MEAGDTFSHPRLLLIHDICQPVRSIDRGELCEISAITLQGNPVISA